MPKPVNDVTRVLINVNVAAGTFTVQAGSATGSPGLLPFFITAGNDPAEVALLKEILGKVGAAYPGGRISLCVRDPDNDTVIVADAECAAVTRGIGGLSPAAAPVFGAAAPAPKAPRRGASKPRAGARRKAPKKKND